MTAGQKQALFLSARRLEEFLRGTPTPFYLYDEKSLMQAAEALFRYFSWNEGFLPLFPVRMNPNAAVLRILAAAGCGALCATLPELELAVVCGFSGTHITYAPELPDVQAEQRAHALGAVFQLRSAELLPQTVPATVSLMLRQDNAAYLSGKMGSGMGRSGAGMEEQTLLRLAASLAAYGTQRFGLCVQGSELCMEEGAYPAAAERLCHLARTLQEKTGITALELDLGGGLGVSYRRGYPEPDAAAVSEAVRACVQTAFPAARLRMSPGRYLAAKAGVLVTRAVSVQQLQIPLVQLDFSYAQCLRLTKSGGYQECTALRRTGRPVRPQLLSGCGSSLSAGPMRRTLPELRPGDPVIIEMLGADGRSLSCAYGGAAPCREYLVRADGEIVPV